MQIFRTECNRQLAERISLVLLLAVFCFRVASLHPREFFGFFQDDTIYFSSAQALASGHGYSAPNFPGVLSQSKYPILFPLIMSAIWRIQPSFPANLSLAIAVSAAIAVAYLLLSYVFLRRLGASRIMGLCVIAAIALQPELEWFAGVLLSDYLFALLVIGSAIAADEAWRKNSEPSPRWGLIAGLLLGLSLLTRSAGIGVVAGIAVCGVLQRRWQALLTVLVACSAVFGIGLIATHTLYPPAVAAGVGAPPPEFEKVLAYNSSYARFWLLSVPRISVLGAMLWANLRVLLETPGFYFVMPGVLLPSNVLTFGLSLLITVLSIFGTIRNLRSSIDRSLGFAALGSLPILLLWNYDIYDRFLLPFVPLIFLGVATELQRMILMLRANLRRGNGNHRILAGAVAAMLIGLAGVGAYNYLQVWHGIQGLSEAEATLNSQRREAYNWIAHNALPSDRVLAYADALTYLYTDRQTLRPLEVTTDCHYLREREKCTANPDDLIASMRYAGARYWVTTPNDYGLQGRGELRERLVALQSRLRPTFVSSDGSVVVYDTNQATPRP